MEAASENWITLSGLESVVQESLEASSGNTSFVEHSLDELITIAGLKSSSSRWVTIAPILMWKSFAQHKPFIDEVWKKLESKHKKVKFIDYKENLSFDKKDEVHLSEKSSQKFFQHIIEESLNYFTASNSNSEDSSESEMEIVSDFNPNRIPKKKTSPFAPVQFKRKRRRSEEHPITLSELASDLKDLRTQVEKRWKADDFLWAKQEESLDTTRNEKILDRIILTGVVIENLTGTGLEKKPLILEALTPIMKELFGDDFPVPIFVSHLNAHIPSNRRVIEAKFENQETAAKVRKAYGDKMKSCRETKLYPDTLRGMNIAMSVTRSTRVRIEILHALAKVVKSNSQKNVDAYVLQHLTRPLLKVTITIPKKEVTTSRTYGFAEAVEFVSCRYKIQDRDLIDAYKAAGNMKNLEQLFMVLRNPENEKDDPKEAPEKRFRR